MPAVIGGPQMGEVYYGGLRRRRGASGACVSASQKAENIVETTDETLTFDSIDSRTPLLPRNHEFDHVHILKNNNNNNNNNNNRGELYAYSGEMVATASVGLVDMLAKLLAGIGRQLAKLKMHRNIQKVVRMAIGLTTSEREALSAFQSILKDPFNESRDSVLLYHSWRLCGESWSNVGNNEGNDSDVDQAICAGRFERIGHHWGIVGFQGIDPATDMRSAGRLSAAVVALVAESEGKKTRPEFNFALSVMALSHAILDGAGIAIAVPRTGGTATFKAAFASAVLETIRETDGNVAKPQTISTRPKSGPDINGCPVGKLIDMDSSEEQEQETESTINDDMHHFESMGDLASLVSPFERMFARIVASAMVPLRMRWERMGAKTVMDFPRVVADLRVRIEDSVARECPAGLDQLCGTIARCAQDE